MAKNKRYPKGERLLLPVAENSVSGSPVAIENRAGVCLTDRDDDGNATVDLKGVYDINVNGNVTAIGQAVYYDSTEADPDDRVTVTSTGNLFFGYALQEGTDEELPVLIGEASGISALQAGQVETENLENNVLSADADGRGKLQDNYFDESTVDDKFEDESIGEVKLADPSADGLNAMRVARATYDVAEDGGAVDRYGLGVTIPDNAIIWDGVIESITELDSANDTATLAVGVENAASDCNDILAATLADGSLSAGLYDIEADGTAANGVQTTGEREITVRIQEEEATAGKIVVFVRYFVSE